MADSALENASNFRRKCAFGNVPVSMLDSCKHLETSSKHSEYAYSCGDLALPGGAVLGVQRNKTGS